MNISQRLRKAMRYTRLDADRELLTEAADEIDALQARASLPAPQQPDNAACGSVQKRLAAQQPATRLPEDVVIGHVTLCKGSNISLLIDHAKRLNNDVERLEALQPQVTLLVNMLESAQQEAQDLHKEVDRLTSTVTPSVPGDALRTFALLVKEAPNYFHPGYDFDGKKLEWLKRAGLVA